MPFCTLYEIAKGKLVWRFYIVPGEPGKPDGAAWPDVEAPVPKVLPVR